MTFNMILGYVSDILNTILVLHEYIDLSESCENKSRPHLNIYTVLLITYVK